MPYQSLPSNEAWVRTACELCLNRCGVLAHKVDEKIVKIDGDPENPTNSGFICAKGNAGMISQISPYRIKKPLIRTNPEKGIGVDPEWKEISWEEALNIVAKRLEKIRNDDPRKLYMTTFDIWDREGGLFDVWADAFGTQCKPFSSGFYCGNNVHSIHLISTGGFEGDPDPNYTKYLLLVGSQFSSVVNYHVMAGATGIAAKRPKNMKVVAIDPVGSYAASRAEEWVPIRPGTDCALLLCISNLLVNEFEIYDSNYLKKHTNAPYLVDPTGHYLREDKTGKPMIWDAVKSSPVPFDYPVTDFIIEGAFEVTGKGKCRSAFQVLKDHLRKYDTKKVSEITTVEEDTIRRVAKEFGEAANIGATIKIDGVDLPYRPACVAWYRGLSAHKHSFMSGLAAILLNTLIGAIDVPGGLLAAHSARAQVTDEGLMTSIYGVSSGSSRGAAYPSRKVVRPKSIDLFELFPVAVYSRPFFINSVLKNEVYKPPYEVEMILQTRSNFVKTAVAPKIIEQVLKKIPFMVSISMELDETAEFADVVFPDVHYLERLCLPSMNDRSGQDSCFNGQRPVVSSPFKTPWGNLVNAGEILMALAERAGFIEDFNESVNYHFVLKDKYKLDPGARYTFREINDRVLRSKFGDDRGLDWYIDNAIIVKKKSPNELYPGAFRESRIHIYFEFMLNAGEEVKTVTKDLGFDFWDTSDYQSLPDWKPCPAYNQKSEEFDLYLTNYKVPQQPMSYGQSNMILQPLTDKHRDDDLMINTETARKKGISDGDEIIVQTIQGTAAKGRARVTELVHPEVVACQGAGGRWAKRGGIKKTRGINFNEMVAFDEEHIDFVSTAVDSCVRIKIDKVKAV